MAETFRVGCVNDLSPFRPLRAAANGVELVVFQVGGEYFAIENMCPHQRASAFHLAVLEGNTVVCPMHQWSFDLRTGKAVHGDGRIRVFSVRRTGDDLLVEIQSPDPIASLKW